MLRDLDFLEIGTSNFDTLIQEATDHTYGMSVEPIRYYLNSLPNKDNIEKVNVAIKGKNRDNTCFVYYVPENVIEENNLPSFLKGCNSINEYHLQHNLLNVQHLVVKEEIRQLSIDNLLKEYNIRKINYLKIDTEGNDCYILLDLYEYLLTKDKEFYPNRILFESNDLTPRDVIINVIEKYKNLGYHIESSHMDTVLVIA